MIRTEDELRELTRRVYQHYRDGTTAQASAIMAQNVQAYLDPERYALEIDTLFKKLPLPLALSVELAQAGSYRAMSPLDVPVLLIRGADGDVRAFLNTCRHRGAPLCEPGHGRKARFSCPYHSWTYDDRGALVGVFGEASFGEIDKPDMGLKSLPCAERAGLIWVGLTPDAEVDIDAWLGDFAAELATLELDRWHVYAQRELDSPGWKITWDGYLEGYHQQAVHPETVGKNTIANLMVVDTYGPHQRFVFGRKSLASLDGLPEPQWDPGAHIRLIHSGFPNLSISGILDGYCLVSQLYPGPTLDHSTTVQTVLVRQLPESDAERRAAEEFSEMGLHAVRDEDYALNFKIQGALANGGNESLLFGRNEPTLQHYHEWVARLSGVNR